MCCGRFVRVQGLVQAAGGDDECQQPGACHVTRLRYVQGNVPDGVRRVRGSDSSRRFCVFISAHVVAHKMAQQPLLEEFGAGVVEVRVISMLLDRGPTSMSLGSAVGIGGAKAAFHPPFFKSARIPW